jgi:hypothetical protein
MTTRDEDGMLTTAQARELDFAPFAFHEDTNARRSVMFFEIERFS